MKNEKDVNIGKIIRIRSDHGKKFENGIFFIIVISMVLLMNFLHLRYHNRMVLLKEKQDTSRDGKSHAEFKEVIHKTLGKSN